MSILACKLAEDDAGTWRIVFDSEDLHLHIEYARRGSLSKPRDWISIDDFLAWRPRTASHQAALDQLLSLITDALSRNKAGD